VWAGWVAVNGVPVLVRTRPELDEQLFHPKELDAIKIASCGVMLVPLRVFVRVVVPDEREIVEGAQMERVLPARGVRVSVSSVGRSTTLSTRPASTCVYWKSGSEGIPYVLGHLSTS